MSKAWSGGSTRRWRKIRADVLERDSHRCRVLVPGVCIGDATQVHHTLGRAKTGDDPNYCVAACEPCNLAVGNPDETPDPDPVVVTAW